jgi:ribonuclease HI
MLKVFQKNLRKCQVATDLALQNFTSNNYSVALFQEPYSAHTKLTNTNIYKCYKGLFVTTNNPRNIHSGNLVVTLVKNHMISKEIYKNDNLLEISIKTLMGEMHLINIYIPPTKSLSRTLGLLEVTIRTDPSKLIILAGDLNARARIWGDIMTNARGDLVVDFIAANHLSIINEGELATYDSLTGSSNVDITISTTNARSFIKDWRILDIFDASDHRNIEFCIKIDYEPKPRKHILYVSEKTDELLEDVCINWNTQMCNTATILDNYSDKLTQAISSTMIWKQQKIRNYQSFPWWNAELRSLRNHCRGLRRLYQSTLTSINPTLRQEYKVAYSAKKKELKKAIKNGKLKSWQRFVQENNKTWGSAFNSVFHSKHTTYSLDETIDKHDLLLEIFPPRNNNDWDTTWNTNIIDDIPISEKEIENALLFSKRGKAPGIDGIPACIWKKVQKYNPKILLQLFNDILGLCYFPKSWKTANIILIPKSGRDGNTAGSFRPISLLPTLSKVMERILLKRINFHVDCNLDSRQFGFRNGLSTIDALERIFQHHRKIRGKRNTPAKNQYCCLFLDIKGAFNNFKPIYSLKNLHQAGCPKNYIYLLSDFLKDRQIILEDFIRGNENGSPQGSCLSPILWNLVMEGLLRLIPDGPNILVQAFADDILIYCHHRDLNMINIILEQVCETLSSWASNAGVTFSHDKCTYISSDENITVTLEGARIRRVTSQKYLGIVINQHFTPNQHIKELRNKSKALTIKLTQIYKRSWGISNLSAKQIYLMVIEPALIYGSSAWFDGTVKMNKNLESAQRTPLLRICNCFSTASTEALQVLSGVLPIDLRIMELKAYKSYLQKGKYDQPKVSDIHPGISIFNRVENLPDYSTNNIFTDGSHDATTSGSAMIYMEDHILKAIIQKKLNPYIDNFICEMTAIKLGVEFMIEHRISPTIFTDSLSCIYALTNDKPKCQSAREILQLALKNNLSININWIKGHSGDRGNDLADHYAKQAARNAPTLNIKPSHKRLKSYLKNQSLVFWKERWKISQKGRNLYQFIQTPSKSNLYTNFYENQFLTGHGYFPQYFTRFNLRRTTCICNTVTSNQANAAHYLNDCPSFLHISRKFWLDPSWRNRRSIFRSLAKDLENIYCTTLRSRQN